MSDDLSLAAELDRYLRTLPPSVQGRLLHELERAELGGEPGAAHRLILGRLRAVLRDDHLKAKRMGTPQRLFCEPLEPFLTDEPGSQKYRGLILRASLNSVWRWIKPQIDRAAEREEAAAEALLRGDCEAAQRIVRDIRQAALPVIVTALSDIDAGSRKATRLAGLLEGERALADLSDIASVLRLEAPLSELAAGLPQRIDRLSSEQVGRLLDPCAFKDGDVVYALRLIHGRLANPAELLQMLVGAAGTDDAARLREHRLAACVDIVLADLDVIIEQIGRHIKRPAEFDMLIAAIQRFHSLSSGMSVSIDLDGAEHWRTALANRRRRISEIVGGEVSRAPGAVRRVLKPRRRDGTGPAAPGPHDIANAEHAARLVVALRPYRAEVAVNEILAGVARQVEALVEAANPGIVQELRTAEGEEREAARAVFAAALSINEIVFGKDYAALLWRSGRLADPQGAAGEAKPEVPVPAA